RVELSASWLAFRVGVTQVVRRRARLLAPDQVYRPARASRHRPGGWILRHAFGGPLLQGAGEGLLREILRQPHVAYQPSQGDHEIGRLHPPDRLDRAPDVHAPVPMLRSGRSGLLALGTDLLREPRLALLDLGRVPLAEVLLLGVRPDLEDLTHPVRVGGA